MPKNKMLTSSRKEDQDLSMIKKHLINEKELSEKPVVLKGQYDDAYNALDNAVNASLTPALVGPPGMGKSLIARKYAQDTNRPFYEVFFDDTIRPSSLVGYFDPAITLSKGYCLEAFIPGPLLKAMMEGGIFLAQELNRATEYCQNTLLAPLEERRYYVPRLGHICADDKFVLIGAMNPSELGGTYRLSEALKDRIGVWIPLTYPSKEIETEIIKVNSPEYGLDNKIIDTVYSIISKARDSKDMESPSIRDGIAIARLVGEIMKKKKKITKKDIASCSIYVLGQNVKNKRETREVITNLIGEIQ